LDDVLSKVEVKIWKGRGQKERKMGGKEKRNSKETGGGGAKERGMEVGGAHPSIWVFINIRSYGWCFKDYTWCVS